MEAKQKLDFLINVAYWAFVLLVVYLVFKYVFPITIPFILGFGVAYLVVKVSKKTKWNQKLLRILLILFFYATIGVLLALVVLKGFAALNNGVAQLPSFYERQIAPLIKDLYDRIIIGVGQLEPEIQSTIRMLADNLLSAVKNLFGTLSETIISFVSGIVKGVPSLFLSILAMIISTFFFALDYEKMEEFIHSHLIGKWKSRLQSVKYYFTNTLLVVVRSYAIITVVRNYVEPKIVGAQLGIHPIITLVSMFIGLRLFGFFGLFGMPVAISFFWKKLREVNKSEETEVN